MLAQKLYGVSRLGAAFPPSRMAERSCRERRVLPSPMCARLGGKVYETVMTGEKRRSNFGTSGDLPAPLIQDLGRLPWWTWDRDPGHTHFFFPWSSLVAVLPYAGVGVASCYPVVARLVSGGGGGRGGRGEGGGGKTSAATRYDAGPGHWGLGGRELDAR